MAGEFQKDLDRMFYGRSRSRRIAHLVLSSELHCVACYRLGQYARSLRRRRNPLFIPIQGLHRVWNRWCTHVHHCEISPRAQIGPGFMIMHRNGVIIGPVKAGCNLTIHHNVTLGLGVANGDHHVPTLGNRVWIGPGATISGGLTIGDRVTISAGSILTRDVPGGCLVAGNPARVIGRDYDSSPMMRSAIPDAKLAE